MLPEELKEYISFIQNIQSETDAIEAKAAHVDCPKKLYDTLSSFSNKSGGGIIIFGLNEKQSFEAVGVYNANDLQKKVTQQCTQMYPKVRPIFTILKMDNGNTVVSAEIPEVRQDEKPCYYTGAGMQKGSYIRVGDSDEPMSSFEIYNLFSYKNRVQEDLRPIERAKLEDLDMEKLCQYVDKIKKEKPNFSKLSNNQCFERLGIVTENNKNIYPTITGILAFGLYPQAFLPQLTVTAVVVPGFQVGDTGDLGERFLDNKKIEGTIAEMIDGTMDFILKNMKERTVIRNDNAKREDKPEYPIPAIREAVINALVHRDYSSYTEGSYVQVRMFNDRIEIQSPGGLYGEVTLEMLSNNRHDIRNKNLVRILEDIKVVENRGSGILTMIKELRDMKLEPPVFEERRGDFWVTFKNHTLMTKEDLEWLRGFELELTENEALALTFIKRNEKITNGDYQRLNNTNRDKALSEIKGLINKGVLTSQGMGSGTYYILNDTIRNLSQVSLFDNVTSDNKTQDDTQQDKAISHKNTLQDEKTPHKKDQQEKIEDSILELCISSKSKKEIADFLSLKDIRNLTELYIKPLIEKGKLQMTLPDKPTSKNQKYITIKE